MMNYYGRGYSYGYDYGQMAQFVHSPFFAVMGFVMLVLALVWLGLVILALHDLVTRKPRHAVAWAFVIVLGKVIGPIGYYFIVVKDRMKK